ncbi:hypothetical protein RI129_000478 [Pyrocoelia pectoralis]|uniref:Sperm microtubule inner protein 1 C-terminal domain-containing protein n=1 Tax=Pyrocoelia pectoralis TaxID=417401 RepID=A0AAN7VRN4_9COLE
MGEQKRTNRGIDPSKMKIYTDSYEKENRLRLKWFRKNEERLVAYTEKPNTQTVPQEVIDEVANKRKISYQEAERYPRIHFDDAPPPLVDPNAIYNTMKPVDPDTKKLIYTGTQKDGRLNYFHERVKILPEDKFYFAETTSWRYGWNMWNSANVATPVRYGRCQVIKASFYRRNGVARDPDWYQEPATLSPCICNLS